MSGNIGANPIKSWGTSSDGHYRWSTGKSEWLESYFPVLMMTVDSTEDMLSLVPFSSRAISAIQAPGKHIFAERVSI